MGYVQLELWDLSGSELVLNIHWCYILLLTGDPDSPAAVLVLLSKFYW